MSKVAHTFKDKTRTGDVIISESVEFSNLLLSDAVLNGLKNSGFVRPSPIQLKAIPLGRCGLDLIVQAKSGTGKTCVFSVIALESLVADSASLQVLVLAPTREIAVQIWEVINSIGSAVNGLQCHTFIGGMPLHEDRIKLRKCHIAVGSPGRIKQLIETGALRTDSVRMFILDEADKLLEESFQEQINWIYSTLPENKQMLALSATYPEYLANHLTAYMRNPTFLRLNISDPALLGIRQYYQVVAYHPMSHIVFEEKTKVLSHILSTVSFQQCLVFSNLQTRAQTLADSLTKAGWPTSCIAGCLDQTERNNAMAQLKSYKCRVLISTDLTARGIDADKVNLVINMDIPKDHETYLHRIGRAGRFGSFGIAITLISEGQERLNMNSVEKKCNTQIHLLPDPIPSDLAKPDCPILLDDVVSSEVINNENMRHSLPNSPRKNGTQSYTEIREETKDTKLDETERTDKSCSIETFPYTNISNSKSVTELSLKQASLVSENKFADSGKMANDSSKDETYARTDELRLNGCLDNDHKDSDKLDKLMSDVAVNQKKTKMPYEKSSSQIGNNKNFHVCYKTEDLSDENTKHMKDMEEEKDKNRNYGLESMEMNDQSKFTTLWSRDSYKYEQNAEKDSPFQNLQNLNINDIIQHNIGYKKLTKYNTYRSALQSLMEARNQTRSVSQSVAETGNQEKSVNETGNQAHSTLKDSPEVYDRLHAYCRLPGNEHPDTEVLRKAISQLQYHHECGSSSSVISSVTEILYPSTLISDPTSGNVDARNTETDDPIVDNITVREHESDFKSKTEDNISAKKANQVVESSLTYGACGIGDRHIEKDIKPTDTDHKPGHIELKEEKLVTSGADIEMSVNSDAKTENMTTLNSKKKRFGYRGHFAIGHLLQQEREKPSDKHNDESVESVETGHVISTQTDVAKQDILTVDNNVNDERLIKSMEVLNLESGQDELNLKKHFEVSEASYNVDENAKLVGSEAHSFFGKPVSNGESFNLDTFQYSEEPLEKCKENSFGASLDYVDNHITESEVENEFDDLAKSDFESSDSSCESSSEVTDSDTESSCENIDETESGCRIKQKRRYEQDWACSQSRSVTSESCGSRTCDSGVYSRQSYQDYWRQWYNDWSTYCQQQGWNSSNPTWPPYGCYGNQFSYPTAYHGYGNPYPAGMPSYPQWNYIGALRGTSAQHGPSNHQWQSYGDFRYNFYPGAMNQTRSDGSSLNSPDSMQDVFKFQSEYIKQMCKNDDSRKSKDSTS